MDFVVINTWSKDSTLRTGVKHGQLTSKTSTVYNICMKKLILASSSPRRKEIFSKLRLPFEVEVGDYEEDMTLPLSPAELAQTLSKGKAESVAKNHSDAIVVAADTFIVFGNKVLGKPKTAEKAREMLRMLRGKENNIITGVTIIDTGAKTTLTFDEITKVFMRDMSDSEIEGYVKTGEPLDKAGAYALQELGAIFIEKIEGDFFNAMGLPLATVARKLEERGIRLFQA